MLVPTYGVPMRIERANGRFTSSPIGGNISSHLGIAKHIPRLVAQVGEQEVAAERAFERKADFLEDAGRRPVLQVAERLNPSTRWLITAQLLKNVGVP